MCCLTERAPELILPFSGQIFIFSFLGKSLSLKDSMTERQQCIFGTAMNELAMNNV